MKTAFILYEQYICMLKLSSALTSLVCDWIFGVGTGSPYLLPITLRSKPTLAEIKLYCAG